MGSIPPDASISPRQFLPCGRSCLCPCRISSRAAGVWGGCQGQGHVRQARGASGRSGRVRRNGAMQWGLWQGQAQGDGPRSKRRWGGAGGLPPPSDPQPCLVPWLPPAVEACRSRGDPQRQESWPWYSGSLSELLGPPLCPGVLCPGCPPWSLGTVLQALLRPQILTSLPCRWERAWLGAPPAVPELTVPLATVALGRCLVSRCQSLCHDSYPYAQLHHRPCGTSLSKSLTNL